MGKRKFKDEVEDSDVESNENGVEEEDSVDSGAKIPPNVIREFCEIINRLVEANVIDANMKAMRLAKLEAVQLHPSVISFLKKYSLEYTHLMEAFNKYLTRGLSKLRVGLNVAISCTTSYCASGESIRNHPRFPSAPSNQFQKFLSKNHKTIRDVSAKEMEQYRSQRAEDLDEESKQEHRKFVEKLNAFLDEERSSLTPDQVKFISTAIKRSEKKYKPPHEKTPVKKSKKEATLRSAFDFFKMGQGSKYQDMDPAKRDLKLRKKFDKLDDDAKELYINLEKNQNLTD